ncbi:unnamed protein product, partial [Ectocarpus sp. 13 AM-2016]
MKDLTKYGSAAVARGQGLKFETTSSPVDPGDKGKVAEAVDVCFPSFPDEDEDSALSAEGQGPVQVQASSDVTIAGGYRRGVFVRAARGSSIDVGLFHDDQRRSVATVEVWVNAGKKATPTGQEDTEAEEDGNVDDAPTEDEFGEKKEASPATAVEEERRFRQGFHVLACRVSASGEHVWSLVVENNGQVAFIPGPGGRRDLGPGFSNTVGEGEDGKGGGCAKIVALKEAVYTEPGAFSWDKWTHVAVSMDTSRDESSAEVRLFLDGLRVGFGTCRFNKVRRISLSDTWMVLGPDLVGWKLSEARVWAMLRDEDALQARHTLPHTRTSIQNSLSLAEIKKARLIIRAASKAKTSAPTLRRGPGGATPVKLAPPPRPITGTPVRRRVMSGLAPPPQGASVDLGQGGMAPLPGSGTKDPRKARSRVGSGSGIVIAPRLRPPDSPFSRDPRKAALAARHTPSKPKQEQQPDMDALAAPAPPLDFAAFPATTQGDGSGASLPAGESQQSNPKVEAEGEAGGVVNEKALGAPETSAPVVGEVAEGAPQLGTSGFASFPPGGTPAEVAMPMAGFASFPDMGSVPEVVSTPTAPPTAASFTHAWANFEDNRGNVAGDTKEAESEVRYPGLKLAVAPLATPTESDVSSLANTPSSSSVTGGRVGVLVSKFGGGGTEVTVIREGEDLRTSNTDRLTSHPGALSPVSATGQGNVAEESAPDQGASTAGGTDNKEADDPATLSPVSATGEDDVAADDVAEEGATGQETTSACGTDNKEAVNAAALSTASATAEDGVAEEGATVQETTSAAESDNKEAVNTEANPVSTTSEDDVAEESATDQDASTACGADKNETVDAAAATPAATETYLPDQSCAAEVDGDVAVQAESTTVPPGNDDPTPVDEGNPAKALEDADQTETSKVPTSESTEAAKTVPSTDRSIKPVAETGDPATPGHPATPGDPATQVEANVKEPDDDESRQDATGIGAVSVYDTEQADPDKHEEEEEGGAPPGRKEDHAQVVPGPSTQVSPPSKQEQEGEGGASPAREEDHAQVAPGPSTNVSPPSRQEEEGEGGASPAREEDHAQVAPGPSTQVSPPSKQQEERECGASRGQEEDHAQVVPGPSTQVSPPPNQEEAEEGGVLLAQDGEDARQVPLAEIPTQVCPPSEEGGATGGGGEGDLETSEMSSTPPTPLGDSNDNALPASNAAGTTSSAETAASSDVVELEQATTSEAAISTPMSFSSVAKKIATTEEKTAALTQDPRKVASVEQAPPSSTGPAEHAGETDALGTSHGSGVTNAEPESGLSTATTPENDDSPSKGDIKVGPTSPSPTAAPEKIEASTPEPEESKDTIAPPAAGATDAGGGAGGGGTEIRSLILAGSRGVFSTAELAEGHARSPLLGSIGTVMSLASSQKKVATVAIVDLWNGGATTRYPIGCVSAILSPRTDEQVIALLSERGMQVFSVTHRVRKRHVVIKSSSVRLWKWIGDDVIVIITKEEVLRWDVRGTAMPKKLFTRNRPYSPSPTDGASRACDYQCTADGRWGLLFVADKERLCDGCRHEPHATTHDCCACE